VVAQLTDGNYLLKNYITFLVKSLICIYNSLDELKELEGKPKSKKSGGGGLSSLMGLLGPLLNMFMGGGGAGAGGGASTPDDSGAPFGDLFGTMMNMFMG